MRNRTSALFALAAFFSLILVVSGNVLFGGGTRVVGYQFSDLLLQFFSWRDFGFRELRHGNLALWNPHVFGGAPYFGTMQGALLYPPNWIFLVLPLPVAINWSIALHVFAAGAFMFCWMRQRKLTPTSSFFAGAMAMFCGAFYLHVFAGHLPHLCTMIWSPLIFCTIEGLLETRNVRWGFLGTFAVVMQILAGFPQYVFYTAIVAALYSGLRIVRQRDWRLGAVLLGLYPAAAALAAVQLLPAFQATNETIRGTPLPFQFAATLAFPPENLVTLLLPHFFGPTGGYWGRGYLWETSLSVSVTGFAFAVYALIFCERKQTTAPFIIVITTIILALGTHTPLFRVLYDWFPGFDKFRSVSKFGFLGSLFLILLAATGLDRVGIRKKIEPAFVIAVFIAAVLLGGIGFCLTTNILPLPSLMESARATGESFLRSDFYNDAGFIAQSRQYAAMSLFAGGGVCLLLAIILAIGNRDCRAFFGVIVLGTIEVFVFACMSRPTFDSALVADAGTRRFIDEHPGDYRIMNPVNPNSAMSVGAQDIWGYDASVVRRYAEFMTWTQNAAPDQAVQYLNFGCIDPLYSMLRLRYVFVQQGTELNVADPPVPPMPHLQLVSNYRVITKRDDIFEAMRSVSFDPGREVILESEPELRPSPGEAAGSAEIVASSTDALTIKASITQPSILLITDTFTPSWRAKSLPGSVQTNYQLLPANYILRAVPLAAGHHLLRVEYSSAMFDIGKWISIISGVIFFVAMRYFWKFSLPL